MLQTLLSDWFLGRKRRTFRTATDAYHAEFLTVLNSASGEPYVGNCYWHVISTCYQTAVETSVGVKRWACTDATEEVRRPNKFLENHLIELHI